MTDERDGVDEALYGSLRVGLTAAGQVAEVVARAREQGAREARATSEQQARELGARLHAERLTARAAVAPASDQRWWASASPQDVSRVWETARSWEAVDPGLAQTADQLRREIFTRYGVDADAAGADVDAVRRALEERGIDHSDVAEAGAYRRAAEQDVEAAQLLTAAAAADRAQDAQDARDDGTRGPAGQAAEQTQEQAEVAYDSAARRYTMAANLDGVADPETTQARVTADTFQGRPAQEAVVGSATTARARRGLPSTVKSQQRPSAGLGR